MQTSLNVMAIGFIFIVQAHRNDRNSTTYARKCGDGFNLAIHKLANCHIYVGCSPLVTVHKVMSYYSATITKFYTESFPAISMAAKIFWYTVFYYKLRNSIPLSEALW